MLRKIQVLFAAMACGAFFGATGIDSSVADVSAACRPGIPTCGHMPSNFPMPHPPGGGRAENDKWI
ncbi:hypothetical protein [Planobispora longispora]|uniref:Uncharacterized protein n=1 Tax=Planobispora longispora TaxID=28887 RepID=A0A8J3W3X1_9ACTN|nr:hypothetical protein [Planobispora longispora]BFE86253.1 hypothetical protein GCM10020093_088540 [Planobispora longispora]GIH75814.1 hypothetical protein Plo01_22430 [Planobispora longispora]